MGLFSKLFGGAANSSPPADACPSSDAEMQQLLKTYFEVQKDEGATGRPSDYAATLNYMEPSNQFPARWPGTPLCGCCSAPFSLDARQDGIWMAEGKKDGRPVPICAVCITHLNGLYMKQHGRAPFTLRSSYDEMGQQLAAKFGADSVQKVAVTRIALIRARTKAG